MDVSTALGLLSDITYKPNFRLSGREYDRFDRAIMLVVKYEVPESNVAYAPTYKFPTSAEMEFIVLVGDCDTEIDFATKVFACLIDVETHEAREFFAIGGTGYEKPFHPHTTDGIYNYNQRRMTVESDDMALNAVAFARRPINV